jgi:hypothetical protein
VEAQSLIDVQQNVSRRWLASAIAMSRAEERRSVAGFSNSARFSGLVQTWQ